MGSTYPGGLDSLPTDHSDSTHEIIHATTDNDQSDAINKIEATLGINPHGSAASVAARLAASVDATGALIPAAVRNALGGSISAIGDVTFNSDSDVSGAGDIIFQTGGSERGRVLAADTGVLKFTKAWFGNATLADYRTASLTDHQVVKYFGQNGQITSLLPQASLTRATWFDTTTVDSMQGNASQSLFTNLGTPKAALRAIVADEADALIQAGNTALGYVARMIGHIAACEAQGSGTQVDFAYARSVAAKSARDAGSLIRQHAAYHAEDQTSGISGKVGAAWSVFVPLTIHSRDSLAIAQYTGVEGHLTSASSISDVSVTLEIGQGAGGFRGSSAFANGQVVQVDVGTKAEVRTISTVVGDVLTFTVALSKAHSQYARVAVLDGNGYGMWYMSSNSIKTDSVVVGQSFSAIQFVITAANGAGFHQLQTQSGGTPGTPSAGTGRFYFNGQKVFVLKNEDGIESSIRVGHRKTSAVDITLNALQGGICAITDTTSARAVTLPAANAVPAGWDVIVKDESGGAATHNITVSRAGADTIEGGTSKVISANYGSVTLYSDGTSQWFVR